MPTLVLSLIYLLLYIILLNPIALTHTLCSLVLSASEDATIKVKDVAWLVRLCLNLNTGYSGTSQLLDTGVTTVFVVFAGCNAE